MIEILSCLSSRDFGCCFWGVGLPSGPGFRSLGLEGLELRLGVVIQCLTVCHKGAPRVRNVLVFCYGQPQDRHTSN